MLSRDQLLTMTRNREWEPFDRSIDIRITRLRRKVEEDPAHPRAIKTVRGSVQAPSTRRLISAASHAFSSVSSKAAGSTVTRAPISRSRR